MNAGNDLLFSICNKGVQMQIHHGALFCRSSDKLLTEAERSFLKQEREVIDQALDRTRANLADFTPAENGNDAWLPLTFQQELILSHHHSTFFCVFPTRIRGTLDVDALRRSLRALVQRHDALRMRLALVESTIRQEIGDPVGVELKEIDCSDIAEADKSQNLQLQIRKSLENWLSAPGPTFEATLFMISQEDHVLVILWDHLFEDYVSSLVVFGELWAMYSAYRRQQTPNLAKVTMRYGKYTLWQRQAYAKWFHKHGNYWREKLAATRTLHFGRDDGPLALQPLGTQSIKMEFGSALTAELRKLARVQQVPLFVVVVTIFCVAISSLCDQLDFVIPFVSTGRYRAQHCEIVGYLPHVVLLRLVFSTNDRFSDLLRIVFEEATSASEKVDIGISLIDGAEDFLCGPRLQWFQTDPFPSPCIMPPSSEQKELELEFEHFSVESLDQYRSSVWSDLPFVVSFWDSADGVHGSGVYRGDLLRSGTIRKFVDHLCAIAERAVKDQDVRLEELQDWWVQRSAVE